MFFMMGVYPGRKEFEYSQFITCNECGHYGRYTVYMTYMVLSLFFIPVFKWGKRYFVETTCCHTVYELDPEVGARIARGEELEIVPDDLMKIGGAGAGGSTYKKCRNCGYETSEDFEYCPKCGIRF